jgi:hypothetical protein
MNQQIEKAFTYHKPHGNQPQRYTLMRDAAKQFAEFVDRFCPDSREKSLAFTKLEECIMWANAAIARNEAQNEDDERGARIPNANQHDPNG